MRRLTLAALVGGVLAGSLALAAPLSAGAHEQDFLNSHDSLHTNLTDRHSKLHEVFPDLSRREHDALHSVLDRQHRRGHKEIRRNIRDHLANEGAWGGFFNNGTWQGSAYAPSCADWSGRSQNGWLGRWGNLLSGQYPYGNSGAGDPRLLNGYYPGVPGYYGASAQFIPPGIAKKLGGWLPPGQAWKLRQAGSF